MESIVVNAPCVVKLLGEHAVVHGKTAVAVALKLYATASFINSNQKEGLEIELNDYNKKILVEKVMLNKLSELYEKRASLDEYIKKYSHIDETMLPYLTIAATFYKKYGAGAIPNNGCIVISSKIPKQSGLASSASCYVAFTMLLCKLANINLNDTDAIELARDGERVSHRNEGAGRIDVSTAYYGGYVSFSNQKGFIRHYFNTSPKFLIINTGPKKPTSQTVGRVTELLKENKNHTEKILEEINECSIKGLEALANNRMKELGTLMYKDHELLKQLEVSSKGLDNAVDIAKKHNAHGAKLSGGGGGGIAIALLEEYDKKLEEELENEGFSCIKVDISEKGYEMITV